MDLHQPGMVGQTESHFPSKVGYAIGVFDHDKEYYTSVRIIVPEGGQTKWHTIEVA